MASRSGAVSRTARVMAEQAFAHAEGALALEHERQALRAQLRQPQI